MTDIRPGRAALSGLLAAGVALATTELITAPGSRGPTLITAVGSRFIDRFGGSLKDVAVSLFGTNDKSALIAGIVVVCLAIGAVLGIGARRRRSLGSLGIGAIGAVGVWAGVTDPLASDTRIVVGAVGGVAAGVATLFILLAAAATSKRPADVPAVGDPRVKTPSRRSFLGFAGGAALVAVGAGGAARVLRGGAASARAVARIVVPPARRIVSAPASQPFTVEGLTSYITSNDDFYRIDTALLVPRVDLPSWKLSLGGMVDRPYSVTFDELLAMDLIEEPITMQCVSNEVGGHLIGTARWRGVPLRDLLDRAGVQRGATQIVGRSVDGFTAGFPTAAAYDGRTAMLVVGMNDEALPARHGFPARLVVAGLYGYVSATKWLKEIQLTRLEDFDGYWIPRGWAKNGPIKTQSRIDVPRDGARLHAGRVTIAGVAWAPTRGIARVEVRVDNSAWMSARLGEVASGNTWVQWLSEWDARPGEHVIAVRATDGTGAAQTGAYAPPRPDGATGYHQRRVTVR